jgi:hypothetical protein
MNLNIFNKIDEKYVEYKITKKKLRKTKIKLKEIEYNLEIFENAKAFILEVSKQSQEQNKNYLEYLVTLMIQTVFGNEYKAVIEIKEKYDQQTIHFYIDKNGDLTEPRDDLECGGIFDIYAFGLKIGVWSLESDSESIMFFDEKLFHNIDKKKLPLAAEAIKIISEMLKIQIILITHEKDLIKICNKVIDFNGD